VTDGRYGVPSRGLELAAPTTRPGGGEPAGAVLLPRVLRPWRAISSRSRENPTLSTVHGSATKAAFDRPGVHIREKTTHAHVVSADGVSQDESYTLGSCTNTRAKLLQVEARNPFPIKFLIE
jgi:hypothetical protein